LLSGVGRAGVGEKVHLHPGKGREAPFHSRSIQLDGGPRPYPDRGGEATLAVEHAW